MIVLGGSPAGVPCTGQLAEGGLQVAIVERELVGGELAGDDIVGAVDESDLTAESWMAP